MRVLVCDDDVTVADYLKTCFELDGWSGSVVHSGQECLDALQDELDLPDVLVLDQVMPGLLGTQVAARLRKQGFDRPIVLCSAHVAPEHRSAIKRLGLHAISKIDAWAVIRTAGAAVAETAVVRR